MQKHPKTTGKANDTEERVACEVRLHRRAGRALVVGPRNMHNAGTKRPAQAPRPSGCSKEAVGERGKADGRASYVALRQAAAGSKGSGPSRRGTSGGLSWGFPTGCSESGGHAFRALTQVGPVLAVDVEREVAAQVLVAGLVIEDQPVRAETLLHRAVLALVVAVALCLVREVAVGGALAPA